MRTKHRLGAVITWGTTQSRAAHLYIHRTMWQRFSHWRWCSWWPHLYRCPPSGRPSYCPPPSTARRRAARSTTSVSRWPSPSQWRRWWWWRDLPITPVSENKLNTAACRVNNQHRKRFTRATHVFCSFLVPRGSSLAASGTVSLSVRAASSMWADQNPAHTWRTSNLPPRE